MTVVIFTLNLNSSLVNLLLHKENGTDPWLLSRQKHLPAFLPYLTLQFPNHLSDSHYLRSLQTHMCTAISPTSSLRRAYLHTWKPLPVSLLLNQLGEHLSLNFASRQLIQHTNTGISSKLHQGAQNVGLLKQKKNQQKKPQPLEACAEKNKTISQLCEGEEIVKDLSPWKSVCVVRESVWYKNLGLTQFSSKQGSFRQTGIALKPCQQKESIVPFLAGHSQNLSSLPRIHTNGKELWVAEGLRGD